MVSLRSCRCPSHSTSAATARRSCSVTASRPATVLGEKESPPAISGSQIQQVHDLCEPRPSHPPNPRQLRVIAHLSRPNQPIKPNRQRHQPGYARNASFRHRLRRFACLEFLLACARLSEMHWTFDSDTAHFAVSFASILIPVGRNVSRIVFFSRHRRRPARPAALSAACAPVR